MQSDRLPGLKAEKSAVVWNGNPHERLRPSESVGGNENTPVDGSSDERKRSPFLPSGLKLLYRRGRQQHLPVFLIA